MSKIFIPEEQEIYPNPNEHVNFEFGNSIEEFRTARYLNQILKMFGPDIVLWGLTLQDYTKNNNTVSLTFSRGSLIQDSTLIKLEESFTKSITIPEELYTSFIHPETNREVPNSEYSLVVYTDFLFDEVTETPTSNPLFFNIKTALYKNNQLYNVNLEEMFLTDRNRIILHASPIDAIDYTYDYITINGEKYEVRGSKETSFQYEKFTFDGGVLEIC